MKRQQVGTEGIGRRSRVGLAGCAVVIVLLSGCGGSGGRSDNGQGGAPSATGSPTPTSSTSEPGRSSPTEPAPGQPSTRGPPKTQGSLPVDRSTTTPAVSLPWRLTKVDTKRRRIYLATEVKACNLPISVRVHHTPATVTVTVVGTAAPKNKICPDYVRPEKGYVQLPFAIGDRTIKHAPTTGAQSPVTP